MHVFFFFHWYNAEMLLLSNNVNDYYFVSQGKTTIPGLDDGEELLVTDVSACLRSSKNIALSKLWIIPRIERELMFFHEFIIVWCFSTTFVFCHHHLSFQPNILAATFMIQCWIICIETLTSFARRPFWKMLTQLQHVTKSENGMWLKIAPSRADEVSVIFLSC